MKEYIFVVLKSGQNKKVIKLLEIAVLTGMANIN
jgi:hypothetical protein